MGEVIPIKPEPPSMTGDAHCLSCGNKWTAVAPVGTQWLECPGCNGHKGAFRLPCVSAGSIYLFTCNCGCSIFSIEPGPIARCYNCGLTHEGI